MEKIFGLKIHNFFDVDPGSGIFLTLDPGSGIEKFGSHLRFILAFCKQLVIRNLTVLPSGSSTCDSTCDSAI
jgi:hypothetical protein